MFNFIKKVIILVFVSTSNLFVLTNSIELHPAKCISLKNQKCGVKKVIIDNDYMNFPYKIKVDRCIGSCNKLTNPYFKVCSPEMLKILV